MQTVYMLYVSIEITMFLYANIILRATRAEKNFYEIQYRILRQSGGYLLKPVRCINRNVFIFFT